MKYSLILVLFSIILVGCETVQSGHKGVEVSWGGETNMNKIYPEGMASGVHWLWDDMVEYDCRERTIVNDFNFEDSKNMSTAVEIAVDYRVNPNKVNLLHTKIKDFETKLNKTIKSAGKEVIPSYTAVDLNLTKRGEAENRIGDILEEELTAFYLEFARIQITDVDLPQSLTEQARRTAEQIEKNKLAAQMAEEKTNLGNAKVAEARANAEAAVFEAQRLKAITTPDMLKFKALEVQMEWAKKGKSPYGENNIFGEMPTMFIERR